MLLLLETPLQSTENALVQSQPRNSRSWQQMIAQVLLCTGGISQRLNMPPTYRPEASFVLSVKAYFLRKECLDMSWQQELHWNYHSSFLVAKAQRAIVGKVLEGLPVEGSPPVVLHQAGSSPPAGWFLAKHAASIVYKSHWWCKNGRMSLSEGKRHSKSNPSDLIWQWTVKEPRYAPGWHCLCSHLNVEERLFMFKSKTKGKVGHSEQSESTEIENQQKNYYNNIYIIIIMFRLHKCSSSQKLRQEAGFTGWAISGPAGLAWNAICSSNMQGDLHLKWLIWSKLDRCRTLEITNETKELIVTRELLLPRYLRILRRHLLLDLHEMFTSWAGWIWKKVSIALRETELCCKDNDSMMK